MAFFSEIPPNNWFENAIRLERDLGYNIGEVKAMLVKAHLALGFAPFKFQELNVGFRTTFCKSGGGS